jgi:hypothetical protein
VKTFEVAPKFPKTAESRVIQALIRFGHLANMKSFKLFQVYLCALVLLSSTLGSFLSNQGYFTGQFFNDVFWNKKFKALVNIGIKLANALVGTGALKKI